MTTYLNIMADQVQTFMATPLPTFNCFDFFKSIACITFLYFTEYSSLLTKGQSFYLYMLKERQRSLAWIAVFSTGFPDVALPFKTVLVSLQKDQYLITSKIHLR